MAKFKARVGCYRLDEVETDFNNLDPKLQCTFELAGM